MDEERTGRRGEDRRRGEGNYEEDKQWVVVGVCNAMLANSFVLWVLSAELRDKEQKKETLPLATVFVIMRVSCVLNSSVTVFNGRCCCRNLSFPFC